MRLVSRSALRVRLNVPGLRGAAPRQARGGGKVRCNRLDRMNSTAVSSLVQSTAACCAVACMLAVVGLAGCDQSASNVANPGANESSASSNSAAGTKTNNSSTNDGQASSGPTFPAGHSAPETSADTDQGPAPDDGTVPDKGAAPDEGAPQATTPQDVRGSDEPGAQEQANATPVPVEAGKIQLSPENTKIGFVGTHAGDKPDPRTGGFGQFDGQVELDPVSRQLQSVRVEIKTDSVWTGIDKLTNHLKSPDFFDVREHPTAAFQSTGIAVDEDNGQQVITGDLTLLGTTKQVQFPATVNVTDKGLTLKSQFTIDRTEFGMDRLQDNVEKEVALEVVIGEKSPSQAG